MAALPRDDERTIPERTAGTIASFERSVDDVRRRPDHPRAKRWLRDVYRKGADLKTYSNELVKKMEAGERWLASHEGHEKFAEREAQWLSWLHEYEAIEDALERAKAVM